MIRPASASSGVSQPRKDELLAAAGSTCGEDVADVRE
jgi:hypothetical protein